MPKAFTIVEGIDAAYGYVLRHTSLTPSDDLYQDIAYEYIRIRKSGGDHQRACSNILKRYNTKRYTQCNNPSCEECSIDHVCYTLDNSIINRIIFNDLVSMFDELLTANEQIVIMGRVFDREPFRIIAKELAFSNSRIMQIEDKAIRKIRRSSKARRILRDIECEY